MPIVNRPESLRIEVTMLRATAIVLLLAAFPAAAQQPPAANPAKNGGMHQMARPPKVVMHNGHPALEYEGMLGSAYVEYFVRQGEPALGFATAENMCQGHVYVTRTRISGDFRGTACESFDVPREGASAEMQNNVVVITAGAASYKLIPQVEQGAERRSAPRAHVTGNMLVRAVNAFGRVYANVRRMAMEEMAQGQGPQTAPAAVKTTANAERLAALTIHSDPGDAQVSINGQARGLTDSEGQQVLQLRAGQHRVRVSLPGYQDFEQAVTLQPGQKQQITAKLEPQGPPPFSSQDVVEMLQGKMSPKRIATLVQERGADFSVDAETEKRLRALGANSDLLLAIATNRKK